MILKSFFVKVTLLQESQLSSKVFRKKAKIFFKKLPDVRVVTRFLCQAQVDYTIFYGRNDGNLEIGGGLKTYLLKFQGDYCCKGRGHTNY